MVNYDDHTHLHVSFVKIRRFIGLLAIFLPAVLVLGSVLTSSCENIQASISHYFYTSMGVVFIAALSGISVLLITYKGYDKIDNIATDLAAFFLLCLVLFPTHQDTDLSCTTVFLRENILRVGIHYTAAALFFLSVAYISYFRFTKVDGKPMTRQKILRNKIYKICGRIIACSLLLIIIYMAIPRLYDWLHQYKPVFWLEWTSLLAFGFSWLVKGRTFFTDRLSKSTPANLAEPGEMQQAI